MLDYPKTKAEASKYRYGTWAGDPEGVAYDGNCCAYGVWGSDRFSKETQCQRKNGYGTDKLYCKQHAKIIKEASAG